ncbi:DUF4012 domain-containing protein [Candidatus Shapirobacteria bacterium]|nr:DUF4012 domain-containing protein [Candidatus Shapirobacteria bacterium]
MKEKNTEIPNLEEIRTEKKQIFFQKKKKVILGIAIFLLIFLGLAYYFAIGPVLALKKEAAAGQVLVSQIKQGWGEKNLAFIREKIPEAQNSVYQVQKKTKRLGWVKIIPHYGDYYRNAQFALLSASPLLEAANLALEAIYPYADILGFETAPEASSAGETTQDRIDFLLQSSHDLAGRIEAINEQLKLADEQIGQIDPSVLPEEFRGLKIQEEAIKFKEIFEEIIPLTGGLRPVLENLPYFLGKTKKMTYLVLFQNDAELRPSGGFLTAYAILEAEDGKFTPVSSHDIYDLDGRFNKRIEAPRPIRDYLPNVYYWNLRDMNLSPDFKVSMETFYPYYQQVPGEKGADGIFAVDTQFLTALLEVIGEVSVPGWGEFSAAPDNRCHGCPQVVYELERMADKPVGTIKTERKAVLGPLMHTILLHVMGAPADKIPGLFEALISGVEGKHLLFYFPDPEKQAAIEALNLGGRVRETDDDYFFLVDTNFAGAKSNMFIEQTVEDKVSLTDDGRIKHEVVIKYQNPAPASDCNLESGGLCLNGLYRNWFRLYVPKGSTLLEMKGSEVEPLVYEELGKTVFEGFFGEKFPLYPNGGTSLVSITYETPLELKNQPYQLLIQKQAGAKDYSYKVSFKEETQEFSLKADKTLRW